MFDLSKGAAEQQQLLKEFEEKLSGRKAEADGGIVAEFLAAIFRYEFEKARKILHYMEGRSK